MAKGLPAPRVSFAPSSHLAVLPYGSGTTGIPKGVMLTHRNLVAIVAQIRPLDGMVADDVGLAVLPLFHIYGMTALLNAALHVRARLVVMPSFDPAEFLGNIDNHKCTIAFIAPPPREVSGMSLQTRVNKRTIWSVETKVLDGEDLAPKELDALGRLAAWLSCREIGQQLYGSLDTVKTHQRALYSKLGVEDRNMAVKPGTGARLALTHPAPREG